MTVAEAITQSVSATGESVELPAFLHQFPLEPRCRVCRNDRLRTKVNDMLATGVSYAMILRALQKDNDQLDVPDRVTIDSIRNHAGPHFPVQNVAKATYRRILERRAQENGVDFVTGVATAITPMAFYETVMVKGSTSPQERAVLRAARGPVAVYDDLNVAQALRWLPNGVGALGPGHAVAHYPFDMSRVKLCHRPWRYEQVDPRRRRKPSRIAVYFNTG